jgi:hypothetical protein
MMILLLLLPILYIKRSEKFGEAKMAENGKK